jgi:hypothetical protein
MSQTVDLNMVSGFARTWPAALLRGFATSLREHALLIAIVVAHFMVVLAMPALLGRPLHFQLDLAKVAGVIWLIGFWSVLIAALVGFGIAAIRNGGARPVAAAFRWLRHDFFRADRMFGGLIVFALLPVFGWDFAYLQALMPFMHALDWDQTFAAWDSALHFGRQPWEWLQPLLGFPAVTSVLSLIYALWFIVLYTVAAWQAFQRRDPARRMQYLLCTTLIWVVIGNIGCTLLASGGPVYYGRLTGAPDPFMPLFRYLDAAHGQWLNFSRDIQETMWGLYLTNGIDGRIAGAVAAMPSLHVASACGFYLVARATDARLGRIFLVFLVLMLLGSVHLGWHYAIDGYAGIAGTVVLWWGCGRLVRWPVMRRLLWGEKHAGPSRLPPDSTTR